MDWWRVSMSNIRTECEFWPLTSLPSFLSLLSDRFGSYISAYRYTRFASFLICNLDWGMAFVESMACVCRWIRWEKKDLSLKPW